jgi:hypothetical protein
MEKVMRLEATTKENATDAKQGLTVLIGCEESQAVCKAFREKGHEAYSCDLDPCSGGHPEWHIQGDVFEAIKGGSITLQNGDKIYIEQWDMGIFFPTCTYLTISANKWYKDQPPRKSGVLVGAERRKAREDAVDFFMRIWYSKIPLVAIENPIGIMSSRFRKPDQVVQPWMFGHGETKATCFWLRGLNPLKPTDIVEGREQRIFKLPKTEERWRLRSKTFPGIAKAMADQWGKPQFIQSELFQ